MRNNARRWRTILLAVPAAAALGFGGSQALAAPSAAPRSESRVCMPERDCWTTCPVAGGVKEWTGLCWCCEY